ncbi:AAA family ATPase [Zoogloea sp.]|jgi:predicted ATPase|uniref:AAA family ATPase n=1 Tax=Zoogloea sp. TaxID=49181 RepID=UPI0037DA1F81
MRLTELSISHYKSVESVDLQDISPITVLVGCNGAGKSNVVDVLRFLRDAVTQGLDHAVSTRGGIGLIRQYSPSKPYRITLQFRFHDEELAAPVSYELALTSLRDGDFRVEREAGQWAESSNIRLASKLGLVLTEARKMAFTRNSEGGIKVTCDGKELPLQGHKSPAIDSLLIGQHFFTNETPFSVFFGGSSLTDFISNIRFSSIYPNTLRQPAHPDTDLVLKENGANWSSILRHLRKTVGGRQALDQIKEMMQVVMPQLEDISTQAVGGFIHPRFKVREASGKVHYFDPSQISDGTLRILGILLALYNTPHPSLMVIEEPEQTVNPALLALLVDAFRESSERTQLFITSHSPHLVDLFPAEAIRVVDMHDGQTRVSPIRASQRAAIKEHLLSIEQIMSADGLLPEDA